MAAATTETPRTYGNWQRPKSAGILGLGSLGTAILFGGLLCMILGVMVGGLIPGLVIALLILAFLGIVLIRDRNGVNVLGRATERAGWSVRRRTGSNVYRSGPLGRTGWGTFQPPGLVAPLRLSEFQDSYGRTFAMLHCPRTSTVSVVISAEPDGASLVDREQVDAWVAHWGLWLANLGDEPHLRAASVTIEAAPDTGARLRAEISTHVDPNAPAFAQAVLSEIQETYPSGASALRGWIAITFGLQNSVSGKKRTPDEMARDLAARMPGLTHSLASTGAGTARPVSARELCEIVRVAYDPAARDVIDNAHIASEPTDITWPEAGPAAVDAQWDYMRHDSAYSVSWAMSAAPRGVVQSGVLSRLLDTNRDCKRKRVTMLYRPIDPARAAAIVEADLTAATFRASSARTPSARDRRAVQSAQMTADEEAAGAGLTNFGLIVTATVNSADELPQARATVDSLSGASRLRLRTAYGTQDSAFAAALPLGLVLPEHLQVPSAVSEKL